eukprot:Partr_v1_DN28798_c1_g1_i1_m61946 putative WD repeat domain 19
MIAFSASDNFIVAHNSQAVFHAVSETARLANKVSLPNGIDEIFPDSNGVHTAVTSASKLSIVNPLLNSERGVDLEFTKVYSVIWNSDERAESVLFGVFDGAGFHVFRDFADSIHGPSYELIVRVDFANTGYIPVAMSNGIVYCLTKARKLVHFLLDSFVRPGHQATLDSLMTHYKSGCFRGHWKDLSLISLTNDEWEEIARFALSNLDIDIALLIYRHTYNLTNLSAIQGCSLIYNSNEIKGKIAVILSEFDLAQEYLLASNPMAALNLRRDLLQWDKALLLAPSISPESVPLISLEYALQLEAEGNLKDARTNFKRTMDGLAKKDPTNYQKAAAGFVRASLRIGDISTAMKMVMDIEDSQYLSECAAILESLKHLDEAALLYEKSKCWEKAADLYAKMKNFNKVGEFLKLVESPKLHSIYARHLESVGDFAAAISCFETAGDSVSICRIYFQLKQPDKAVEIARKSRAPAAAKLVLNWFQEVEDHKSMVEFCTIAGLDDEAFAIAQSHNLVEYYAAL